MTLAEIEQQIETTFIEKGKLLLIQEMSDWLYEQPDNISQAVLIKYLLNKAGEMS